MIITRESEKEALQEAGARLARILKKLEAATKAEVTTADLNELAEKLILEGGDRPVFKGYSPKGAKRPFPAALCTSINDEVVHGIPNESPRTLKVGDIVALDLGLEHKGFIVDSAITVPVGKIDVIGERLIKTAKESLAEGIKEARVGGTTGDISFAIGESIKKAGFMAANELGGHGVGKKVHEEPYIPNVGKRGTGALLTLGMVLAIEPIVNEGEPNIHLLSDGYTIVTRDGKRSAHFEHTILVTKTGPEILTISIS